MHTHLFWQRCAEEGARDVRAHSSGQQRVHLLCEAQLKQLVGLVNHKVAQLSVFRRFDLWEFK